MKLDEKDIFYFAIYLYTMNYYYTIHIYFMNINV